MSFTHLAKRFFTLGQSPPSQAYNAIMPQILGKEVGQIGYGLMGFTWRPQPPPLEQALDAMKAAVNSGLVLWSGAEFYGTPEYNSMTLLNHYFTKYPEDADKVVLSMKGGMNLTTHKPEMTPEGAKRSLDNIISQLGGKKKVDLFSYSRRDPSISFDEAYSFIQKEYIDTGKLGGLALSECKADTIHEASKITKINLVEVELSIFTPDILKNGVAAACAQHDIPIIAYSPIGRGLLTGNFTDHSQFANNGIVAKLPRYQADTFEHNQKLAKQVQALAEKRGVSPAQLAISWVRSMSQRPGLPTIIPIPGATTIPRVQENAKAFQLTEEDMLEIGKVVDGFQAAGNRYPTGAPMET